MTETEFMILVNAVITGSGGMALAQILGIKFEQKYRTAKHRNNNLMTDVAIELMEKMPRLLSESTIEQRMNGACAGGTGAFIDQMGVLFILMHKASMKLRKSIADLSDCIKAYTCKPGIFSRL